MPVMEATSPSLLTHDGERWVWLGGYESRHLPKSAGFYWDKGKSQWWTEKNENAAKLVRFADSMFRDQLISVANEKAERLRASRALTSDANIPCPAGCEFMPFQRAGIAFALQRDATLIGDEMGLGKTLQAIGVINADPAIERVLILCPSSLKLNWRRESTKWLVRKFSIGIVSGDWFPVSCGMVICNYDVLTRHAAKIRAVNWDLVIMDEAHYLKNGKALRTRMALGDWDYAAKAWKTEPIQADRRILMTGTPITNRPIELWPLIHYLDPDTWDNFFRFAHRYCGAKRGRFGFEAKGANNLGELQEKLRSTIMLRRLKRDVLTELPPKRRQVLAVERSDLSELIERERKTWDASRKRIAEARSAVALCNASADPKEYERAVAQLRKAEGIAFQEIARERHNLALAKLPDLIDHLRESVESSVPVVCFVHHKDMVDAICAAFPKESVRLTGDQGIEERQRNVDRFQTDERINLFVGTIMAAGVGITLTRASHVVFGELDWVPGNLTQAEDRCHRIGQRDSVLVQHLVVDGSLDAKMADILVKKQDVIDAALDDAPLIDVWSESL